MVPAERCEFDAGALDGDHGPGRVAQDAAQAVDQRGNVGVEGDVIAHLNDGDTCFARGEQAGADGRASPDG